MIEVDSVPFAIACVDHLNLICPPYESRWDISQTRGLMSDSWLGFRSRISGHVLDSIWAWQSWQAVGFASRSR